MWTLRTLVITLGIILVAKRRSDQASTIAQEVVNHVDRRDGANSTQSHTDSGAGDTDFPSRLTTSPMTSPKSPQVSQSVLPGGTTEAKAAVGNAGTSINPGLATFTLHFFFRSCTSGDAALEHISSLVRGLYYWGGIKGKDIPGNTQPRGKGAGHPRVKARAKTFHNRNPDHHPNLKVFAKLVGCTEGPEPVKPAFREAEDAILAGLDAILEGAELPKPDKEDQKTRVCQAAAFRGNRAAFPSLDEEEYLRMEGLLLREATGRLDGMVDLDMVMEAWLKRWQKKQAWTRRFLSAYFAASDVSLKGRFKFQDLTQACGQLSPTRPMPSSLLLDMYTQISERSGWGECCTSQTFMEVLLSQSVIDATRPPPTHLLPPCEDHEELVAQLAKWRHVGASEEAAVEILLSLIPKPVGRRLLDKRAHFFNLFDAAEAEVERRRLLEVTGHGEGLVDASRSRSEAYLDPLSAWLAYKFFDDALTLASRKREQVERRQALLGGQPHR